MGGLVEGEAEGPYVGFDRVRKALDAFRLQRESLVR